VRIYRFDPEMSRPESAHGSRFQISPLIADGSQIRLQMMYLPADGSIGRHRATTRQFFGVVDGQATVAGADQSRRDIGPGYAAVWEEDEEHEVRTSGGATAICVEGQFEIWAMGVTAVEIQVVDYDPAWPDRFAAICSHIWPAISDIAVRIDHVGSTSVPGLAAKPIIDIDIVVSRAEDVRPAIDRLSEIGYRWRGDLGVVGREAFVEQRDLGLGKYNLYLVIEDNKAHLDHWLLRDLLREDPVARAEYAALKKRNAAASGDDMDFYVAAKAAFVARLLTRARQERGLPAAEYWEPDLDERADR
jgi:GrpB-like predicted nucleotidyltransferase (UPF0157 family)/quercetin dioxygenase-like cupin family protein